MIWFFILGDALRVCLKAEDEGRCHDERGNWTWQVIVSADKARRLEERRAA